MCAYRRSRANKENRLGLADGDGVELLVGALPEEPVREQSRNDSPPKYPFQMGRQEQERRPFDLEPSSDPSEHLSAMRGAMLAAHDIEAAREARRKAAPHRRRRSLRRIPW
jgi:hypothetical protein